MALPIVAVVGRPNVGKSTFVNRIAQADEAIVHEMRGVTRDRSYHIADWNGVPFKLIDTGGIEMGDDDAFQSSIRTQAFAGVNEADVIVFIVDGRTGINADDEEVARVLRKTSKPVYLVVNKMDNPDTMDQVWEFYQLGLGDPWSVSSLHGNGTGDLLDAVVEDLKKVETADDEEEDGGINIAIIGRPNAGKSSLTNRLTSDDRSIVSNVAGTTRDAIDSVIEWKGQTIKLVDTAGMRKKSQVHEDVEYYSMVRGLQAIDRADVAMLVVDATVGVTEQDQKVANMAIDRGCALILLINKWDLVETERQRDEIVASIDKRLAFAPWVPFVNISALTGRATDKVLELAVKAANARKQEIRTVDLNKLLAEIAESGHTVSDKGRRLKMKYATQTGTKPPVFSFFCNAPDLADDNFQRFIENRLRARFDLTGTPIRLKFRRKSTDGGDR